MDMELGPEGALYVIEWGDTFWGSNANAQVVRIEYRPPGQSGERAATMEPAAGMTKRSGRPRIRIEAPADGSFFSFDEPLDYRVSTVGAIADAEITVRTYSGFDTHALLLDTQTGAEGQVTVTRAFTHIPDLHFVDRFAEVEACYRGEQGTESCERVKLHPRRKEAEHIAWKEGGERLTHGLHPASKYFELSALTAMRVEPGEVLAYAPVNLAGVGSITLRYKAYAAGAVELRTGGKDGPLLARIDFDQASATSVYEVQQVRAIEEAMKHDEALQVDDLDEEAYENWSEATAPVSGPETTTELVLVFEGSGSDALLELDWLEFNEEN